MVLRICEIFTRIKCNFVRFLRWVFASCIAHFAEAIQEYVVNLDKAPDPSITKKTFANELSGAYDVLYNTWILTKEMKVLYNNAMER